MYRLAGEYECKIDDRGRIKLPSALLKQFGEDTTLKFTVNRGFEKHLMLYPSDVWEIKTKEIDQLNIYINQDRKAIRYFYRGATKVETDNAKRILIPKSLITYGDFKKEVILFAYQDQIEIWAKDEYEKMISEEPEDFATIAEAVFSAKQNDSE